MSDAPSHTTRPSGASDRERLREALARYEEGWMRFHTEAARVGVRSWSESDLRAAGLKAAITPLLADLAAERTAKEAAERERDEARAMQREPIGDLGDEIRRLEGECRNFIAERNAFRTDRDRLAEQVAALRTAGTGRAEAEPFAAAAKVCHDEQVTIWSGEIAGALSMGGYLRDDLSYDDRIDADRVIVREIRSIVKSAFSHPELDRALPTQTAGGARGE